MMYKRRLYNCIVFLFLLSSGLQTQCNPSDPERGKENDPGADHISPGTLLLKSGFEEGVEITDDMKRITGSDISGFDWGSRPSWISGITFYYGVSDNKELTDFVETTIEEKIGHTGQESRVLKMTVKADDPDHSGTSRVQVMFNGKETPADYKEGYVRYWLKLPNLSLIPFVQTPSWYMILEWMEQDSKVSLSQQECQTCCDADEGGSSNYRFNIGIGKNAGSGEFSWQILGQQVQPCRKDEWRYTNNQVGVPLDEWFLVEAYLKKDAKEGRVYFAVNGQVVLDTDVVKPSGFTGRTQHAINPLPIGHWMPMKNYHGTEWNKEGPISQWYDDFEIWSGFPPGHPALKN